MKKTYMSPEMLAVELGTTTHLMEPSLTINTNYTPSDESTYIGSSEQILTKESKNIWDNEW